VKGADQRTFALLRALWERGFDDRAPDGIHIPEPLAILPEFRMLLVAKAPGVSAGDLLYNPGNVELARRIAAVASKLHRAGVTSRRIHTAKDEVLILHERLGEGALAHPNWSERLAKILEGCERVASRLPPANPVGIHRDFYPAQVLVDGPRCWLLDLDLYCLGDPAVDIGNFIGHMTEHSLRTVGDPDAFLKSEVALRNEYVRLSDGATTAEAIDIYKILTVARHVHISTLFTDRQVATARLLDYCERKLNQGI
jgi:Ser/Thr protein kinase RdoA (MazF antagonist)